MKEIYIIGGGMGNPKLLTTDALEALKLSEEVYAFDRLGELYASFQSNMHICKYSELLSLIESSQAVIIGVLVSGDTGFYSVASMINDRLGESCNIINTCGINCLQYLCSKLRISYEKIHVVSLHGRKKAILGSLAYNSKTFILTGNDNKATDILKNLTELGHGNRKVTIGEFLSMEKERIVTGSVEELSNYHFDSLSVMLFENKHPAQKEIPLFDEDFIRDKTPMTKQEIRWASVNYLKIEPEDIVYDIGAGTGSVSVELSRKAYDGIVYAIEKEEDAFLLLNQNKEKLGAFNVISIFGSAIEQIKGLPVPDKAFIGGSGKELEEIVTYLLEVNPKMRIVINAITLETLCSAMKILKEQNCSIQISHMNISRNKEIGDYNLMMANNPVYIIVGERKLV
jgi:precorrin-6Y C5,15-methyltransferase (decarboxylating)